VGDVITYSLLLITNAGNAALLLNVVATDQ
jgi:uncharacterized repeat protein (TIGR01451 family)